MADQVDLYKTGCRVVPLRPGADRDGVLEQRTGLGVATATQRHRSPVRRQAPVHRGRRHSRQSVGQFVADVDLTQAPQRGHSPITGANRLPVGAPITAQQNRSPTTTSSPYLGTRGPARPYDLRGQPLPERLPGMVAVPARRGAQLVQDRPLLHPAGPLVTRRDRLGHSLPLAHRQSHHRDLPAPGAPARYARVTRAFLINQRKVLTRRHHSSTLKITSFMRVIA